MTQSIEVHIEHLTACPVCKGEHIHRAHVREYNGLRVYYSGCGDCGLMFLNPRMTDQQTDEYYRGTYRDMLGGENGVKSADLRAQQARATVQTRACSPLWGEVKSHLEIGCSAGYLLAAVNAPTSAGVEPDARYHQLEPACNYKVYTSLDDVPEQRYDLISMSHVLEHINHPLEYLTGLLDAHAHAGTRVMVEVPNAEATLDAYLIHHPIAYTMQTLVGLFDRLGYAPLAAYYHALSEVQGNRYLLALFGRK